MKTPLRITVRTSLAIVCGTLGLVLSSCGTVNGVGQDVKTTGRAIQRAAN